MLIGHHYKYRMVLGSISNEGAVGTDPVDPYLSHLTDTYYNIFILPFVCACIIERYPNVHNVICNHNKMQKYDLVIYKY